MGEIVEIIDTHKNVKVYFSEVTERYYINPSRRIVRMYNIDCVFKGYLSYEIIQELKTGKSILTEHGMIKDG